MFLGMPTLNLLESKKDVVELLNKTGRFWEYCNKATEKLSDESVIEKGLLFLEFEDMQQLFDIFGYERCKKIFKNKLLKHKSNYNNIIIDLLNSVFFKIN